MNRPCSLLALASAAVVLSGGCGETVPEPLGAVFTLEEATIADINAAFDAGAVSCERLVQLYLDRIAEYDDAGPQLNSIITVNPQALNAARALDAERASGGPRSRLHCIPVLLKDNIDTDDMPTSNGSVMLKDAMAADDAYVTPGVARSGGVDSGQGVARRICRREQLQLGRRTDAESVPPAAHRRRLE